MMDLTIFVLLILMKELSTYLITHHICILQIIKIHDGPPKQNCQLKQVYWLFSIFHLVHICLGIDGKVLLYLLVTSRNSTKAQYKTIIKQTLNYIVTMFLEHEVHNWIILFLHFF